MPNKFLDGPGAAGENSGSAFTQPKRTSGGNAANPQAVGIGLAAEARESWTQATAIFTELGDLAEAEKVRAEQAASGVS